MASEEKRLLILYVLDVLKNYTDDNHSLTYSEIVQKLNEKYGLNPDSKTVVRTVKALSEYGYEINKHGNNGCSIHASKFDNSELSFLIDAIFSSKSISSKNAKDLIEELMDDCSVYEKNKYSYIYKADEIVRQDSKEFFYVIDTITRAIDNNKQITFKYNETLSSKKASARFHGKDFLMNPYFMINNNGKYYLVCNYDKYKTLSNYRIDAISDIKVVDHPIKPITELTGNEDFSITDYVNEHIYMFSGKTIQATIKLTEEKDINKVVDWFGDKFTVKEKDNNFYLTFKVNEKAFLYWALQYGERIEITHPVSTRQKYIEMLESILQKYKKGETNA